MSCRLQKRSRTMQKKTLSWREFLLSKICRSCLRQLVVIDHLTNQARISSCNTSSASQPIQSLVSKREILVEAEVTYLIKFFPGSPSIRIIWTSQISVSKTEPFWNSSCNWKPVDHRTNSKTAFLTYDADPADKGPRDFASQPNSPASLQIARTAPSQTKGAPLDSASFRAFGIQAVKSYSVQNMKLRNAPTCASIR